MDEEEIGYCEGLDRVEIGMVSVVDAPLKTAYGEITEYVLDRSVDIHRQIEWKETVASFSKEARDLIRTILDLPNEVRALFGGVRLTQKTIRKILRKEGWKHRQIDAAFQDLRSRFK